MIEEFTRKFEAIDLPGFAVTPSTVVLPVFLMLLKMFADVSPKADSGARGWARSAVRSPRCC
ncbi:hypothetical protein BDI4_210021 [Burkholderia diffusa]|nr:hypothetical protein BDI4_210021 [Burkholderia diffusa]